MVPPRAPSFFASARGCGGWAPAGQSPAPPADGGSRANEETTKGRVTPALRSYVAAQVVILLSMKIREATRGDLEPLRDLYAEFHSSQVQGVPRYLRVPAPAEADPDEFDRAIDRLVESDDATLLVAEAPEKAGAGAGGMPDMGGMGGMM